MIILSAANISATGAPGYATRRRRGAKVLTSSESQTEDSRSMGINGRIEDSKNELLEELKEFLGMPSVSAQVSDDEANFRGCARWVQGKLEEAGAEARIMETEGHPVVYAEVGGSRRDSERALLSYGHYDVQPPEPLELWESDPFEPTVRDGVIFARGVADDKGDVLARIQALRLYQQEFGPLPFKLKFLIEGEEEVGSPSLANFVRSNEELLAADACLWEASMKDEADRPIIFCGTKGMLYVELRAKGASRDLHSMYAGIAPNPAWRLVQALRTIRDENGEIALDGLEDLIVPPEKEDLEAISEIPFDDATLKSSWGIGSFDRDLSGEEAIVYPSIGGSGPTSLVATGLGIPTIMSGAVMNRESRIHAPNESVRLD